MQYIKNTMVGNFGEISTIMKVKETTTKIIKDMMIQVPQIQAVLQSYIEASGIEGTNFDIDLDITIYAKDQPDIKDS